jgi:crotonobetainyl-CoA:carnitine CoA-transferase CaiB-like acyl-CoA transferase
MKSAVAVADLFTGMYAVTSILAALRHAERSGEGQQLDVSLLDCQIAMLANLGANYLVSGEMPHRLGNQHASIAPYQVLATADGHIILAVGNDAQFRDFCAASGVDLSSDPRFAKNEARVINRAALTEALGPVMRSRTTGEWIVALEGADVPCGPINTLDNVFADTQVVARRAVETATRGDGQTIRLTVNPVRMSKTPPTLRAAPPMLGEDTDAVLQELLGASETELSAWRNVGAI